MVWENVQILFCPNYDLFSWIHRTSEKAFSLPHLYTEILLQQTTYFYLTKQIYNKKNHTQTNKIKTLIYFEMKSNDKWTASVSIANVQSKICVNRKCMQYSITPNHTRMPNVQKVAPMFCVRRAWFASPHRSESGVSSVSCSAQWPSSYAITIQFWFGYGRH